MEDFICPICGHDRYRIIYRSFIVSQTYTHIEKTIYYECRGCSINFGDPRKFSKDKPISKNNIDKDTDYWERYGY